MCHRSFQVTYKFSIFFENPRPKFKTFPHSSYSVPEAKFHGIPVNSKTINGIFASGFKRLQCSDRLHRSLHGSADPWPWYLLQFLPRYSLPSWNFVNFYKTIILVPLFIVNCYKCKTCLMGSRGVILFLLFLLLRWIYTYTYY